MGLGLAIVKEVARLLGFVVKITSRVGGGTQAIVTIPKEFSAEAVDSAEPAAAAQAAAGAPRRSRILLVEDNDGVRLATELFLRFEAHCVCPCLTAGS